MIKHSFGYVHLCLNDNTCVCLLYPVSICWSPTTSTITITIIIIIIIIITIKVRFAHDLRVSEVCRLLRSSRSHFLNVHRPPEVSDVDYIQLQQVHHTCNATITFNRFFLFYYSCFVSNVLFSWYHISCLSSFKKKERKKK
jgi:hypothetical protein